MLWRAPKNSNDLSFLQVPNCVAALGMVSNQVLIFVA